MNGFAILMLIGLIAIIALLTAMLLYEMRHPPRHTAAYALARGLSCDPGELGLEYEEWILDLPDGARLPVWDIRCGEKKSEALTAVFIHGWGHSKIDSLARAKPFLSLCNRIVVYDLRGHGESENCLSRLGDGEEKDLIELLNRVDSPKYVLVGHSMGSVIALTAAMADDRISGVIAVAPYCEFHPSLQGRLKVAGFPTRPITDLAMFVHELRGITPRSLNESELAQLRCQLLIIHGSEDGVAPIKHGRRIAQAVKGSTFVELEGATHVNAHELDSEQYERIIREYVLQLQESQMQMT